MFQVFSVDRTCRIRERVGVVKQGPKQSPRHLNKRSSCTCTAGASGAPYAESAFRPNNKPGLRGARFRAPGKRYLKSQAPLLRLCTPGALSVKLHRPRPNTCPNASCKLPSEGSPGLLISLFLSPSCALPFDRAHL